MDPVILLALAASIVFLLYLMYTGQFKWLVGVVRNMALGIIGILGINTLLSSMGVAVGVNAITILSIGLLGIPGLLLLYATQLLL